MAKMRKKMSKKKSGKSFKKSASKVHPKNVRTTNFRGGYRL